MVDNQHKKISGYRDLSQEEIDAMNEIKAQGEILGALCGKLAATHGLDQRMVALGKTKLQLGIMCLVRAVAQPTTF